MLFWSFKHISTRSSRITTHSANNIVGMQWANAAVCCLLHLDEHTYPPISMSRNTRTRPRLPWSHEYANSVRQEVEFGAYEGVSHPSNPKFPGSEKAPSRLPLHRSRIQPQSQHPTLVSLGLRSQALPHVCTPPQTAKHTISYGFCASTKQQNLIWFIWMHWTCGCSLNSRPSSRGKSDLVS